MHKDYFRVINHRELLFNDFGDRVAQLLHVELNAPFSQNLNCHVHQELLIVNTHLLFPHNSSMCLERLRQVCSILYLIYHVFQVNFIISFSVMQCFLVTGLQNIAICGIISKGKQTKTFAYFIMRVYIPPTLVFS